MRFLYRLNLWLAYRFLPWSLLNPSPTFLSLGMFTSLDLMLLPNMIESPVNLLSGNHLGRRKVCKDFTKISCSVTFDNWVRFSCAVFWSANSFPVDSKPCDYLCLLSLFCMVLVFITQFLLLAKFTLVVWLVMAVSSDWWCCDETKGLLWLQTHGWLPGTRGYHGF
jgi:hypothetical protein